jgi:hypothetical protein
MHRSNVLRQRLYLQPTVLQLLTHFSPSLTLTACAPNQRQAALPIFLPVPQAGERRSKHTGNSMTAPTDHWEMDQIFNNP